MSDRYVAEIIQLDGVQQICVTWQGFLKGYYPSLEAIAADGIPLEEINVRT